MFLDLLIVSECSADKGKGHTSCLFCFSSDTNVELAHRRPDMHGMSREQYIPPTHTWGLWLWGMTPKHSREEMAGAENASAVVLVGMIAWEGSLY